MKMKKTKSICAAAAIALFAAGAAAFAQPSAEPAPGYRLDSTAKMVKSGTVTGLFLDAKTGECTVEISLGSETVTAVSGSGVKFIGGRGSGVPAECAYHGNSCREWAAEDCPAYRHHGERRYSGHHGQRMRVHHPEAGGPCPWNEGRLPAREHCGIPFRLGEHVLLVYSADGAVLESVRRM